MHRFPQGMRLPWEHGHGDDHGHSDEADAAVTFPSPWVAANAAPSLHAHEEPELH